MNLKDNLDHSDKIYAVDRIEEDIVVCEDRATGNLVNIKLSILPNGIKEGTIIKYSNNRYIIDTSLEKKINSNIQELWNKLKK